MNKLLRYAIFKLNFGFLAKNEVKNGHCGAKNNVICAICIVDDLKSCKNSTKLTNKNKQKGIDFVVEMWYNYSA